jgi:hypothetical protein
VDEIYYRALLDVNPVLLNHSNYGKEYDFIWGEWHRRLDNNNDNVIIAVRVMGLNMFRSHAVSWFSDYPFLERSQNSNMRIYLQIWV